MRPPRLAMGRGGQPSGERAHVTYAQRLRAQWADAPLFAPRGRLVALDCNSVGLAKMVPPTRHDRVHTLHRM
jgi:hypothetical protein